MRARDRFRQLLAGEHCHAAAPVFDPLSARIAEMQGWAIAKLSGSVAKFANLAVPDGIPVSNMSDLADVCARIHRMADLCLIVDADEAGGNAHTVWRTVRDLESAGVCAIEIEDNLVPPRFPDAPAEGSPKSGSRHSMMIPLSEQVGKLRAAVAARRDPATMIVARSSALDEEPLESAIDRIRAYSHTGVEAIMLPNVPRGRPDIEALANATHLPFFVLRLPQDAVQDEAWLRDHRVRIRYLGLGPFGAAVQAIHDSLLHLKQGGDPATLKPREAPATLLRELDRTDAFKRWQTDYLRD